MKKQITTKEKILTYNLNEKMKDKLISGKVKTKSEMSYYISAVNPYHPAGLYSNMYTKQELTKVFNIIFNIK